MLINLSPLGPSAVHLSAAARGAERVVCGAEAVHLRCGVLLTFVPLRPQKARLGAGQVLARRQRAGSPQMSQKI